MSNRRVQGPENCESYELFIKKEKTPKKIISGNKRKDGRSCEDHRKLYLKAGVVTQAKGSAYIEVGRTKVVCSVYDPREIPRKSEYSLNGELFCEFKFAPFACRIRRGLVQDAEEKEYSLTLRRALEPTVCRHEFPNFQVDIYVWVLEDDGSALSAAITCAGLALADASVPMYDLVTATTLGISGDLMILDPTMDETALCSLGPLTSSSSTGDSSNENHGLVLLSYSAVHQQVTQIYVKGYVDAQCITKATKELIKACENILPLVQQCLVQNINKALKEKEKETT